MLLYCLLHLTKCDLTMADIRQFRQWKSRTPGHPEHGRTPGVEVTTGPLGRGVANGVGLAIAERWPAGTFNRPGLDVVNHYTYVLASDGDLMKASRLRLRHLPALSTSHVILIATGSEVSLALEAHARLVGEGLRCRVVSMPCWELFDRQPGSYRDTVLHRPCGHQ